MPELRDKVEQPSQELVKAFVDNALQYSSHMSEDVLSGKVAAIYGPQYTAESLSNLADQMRNEVLELTPGSGYVNEKRRIAMEEEARRIRSLEGFDDFRMVMPKHGYYERFSDRTKRFIEAESRIQPFETYVRGSFYSYFVGKNPSFSLTYDKAKIEMEAERVVDFGEESFHWEMKEEERKKRMGAKVQARVSLSNKVLPVTQEEYFHAAQELSLGNVEGAKYLDDRVGEASKHVTHGSIIMDRILSSAAAEVGPEEFAYWSNKADEVTREFENQHLTNTSSKWDKTPLGKVVNKRFLYPIVDYRELGAMIFNYTRDVDQFLFNQDGSPNEKNGVVFELLSLQFGQLHKDLSLTLVDTVASSKEQVPDFENLGKQLVEWGKRILAYYKGKPEEYELVTHHTDMQGHLNTSNLKYEVSQDLVESLNKRVGEVSGIPTTEITLEALADEARRNANTKSEMLMQAVQIDQRGNTVRLLQPSVLKDVGLDPIILIY